MNEWQILKILRWLLRKAVWPGGVTLAFGEEAVVVTGGPTFQALLDIRTPAALIRPAGATNDPESDEENQLEILQIAITLLVSVENDGLGEAAILGAGRDPVDGQTVSEGRGLPEVKEVLDAAVGFVNDALGVRMQLRAKSAPRAQYDQASGWYQVSRDHLYEVLCTVLRFYHPVTHLRAVSTLPGVVILTWDMPPDRFDRLYRVIVRRSAPGGPAPATMTDGVGVADTNSAVPVLGIATAGLVAGTYAFSVFWGYAEFEEPIVLGTTAADRWSDRQSASVVVA